MNLGEMVTAVASEGGVDITTGSVSEDTVKGRINARYRRMVAESKWRLATIDLGGTVIGQTEYAVDTSVVSLDGLLIDGKEYERIGQRELWRLRAGTSYATGGRYAPDFDPSGVSRIEIFPAPVEAGLEMSGLAPLRPAPLTDNSDTPIVPEEFHDGIVEGAIADFLMRLDERQDLAPGFEAKFETAVEKLRRQKNAETGGAVTQIRVGGYHI